MESKTDSKYNTFVVLGSTFEVDKRYQILEPGTPQLIRSR